MTNQFENPYLSGEYSTTKEHSEHSRRVTYSVHHKDKMFIKLVRPDMGTETISMTILYRKLVAACRARGILDMTQQKDFEHFVANCELTLPEDNAKPKRIKSK